MTWNGIGTMTGNFRPLLGGTAPALPTLSPGPGWTGVARSGFSVIPADPVRVTAKPVVRMIVPDFQRFVGTIDIGVAAFANDRGTLIGGIDRVRFHFEGRTIDVVEPSLHSITDGNGAAQSYFGYWVRLTAATGMVGEANIYIEGIPSDATMQRRVIGPFPFFPVSSLYTHEIEVAATPAEIPGSRYKTLQAACNFITNLSTPTTRPAAARITMTEADTYEGVTVTGLGFPSNPTGRIHLEATAPVTIRFASYVDDGNTNKFDTRIPLWVRGENITFDMQNILFFEHDGGTGSGASGSVFDGCRFINSAGRGAYWRSGGKPVTGLTSTQSAWFLECETDGVVQPFINAQCVRGGLTTNGAGDVCTNSRAVIGHTTSNWTSLAEWAVMVPALTVTGPATSTLSISNGSDASSRVITARVGGSTVGTFTVGNTFALWQTATAGGYNPVTAGQGYFVADVAAWLNSLPGWSATVLDNTRRASAFALTGTKGAAFTNVSTATALTLNTFFDFHDDWYQLNDTGPANVIVFGNRATGLSNQNVMLNGTSGTTDFIFVNNALMNLLDATTAVRLSQFASTHSHVVIAHNSMPAQGIRLNVDSSGYNPDGYCLIANNVLRTLGWSTTGMPDADVRILNNLLDAGAIAPGGATGTVIDGSFGTKFADAVAGNFAPTGILASNLREPVATTDLNHARRSGPTAIGALVN